VRAGGVLLGRRTLWASSRALAEGPAHAPPNRQVRNDEGAREEGDLRGREVQCMCHADGPGTRVGVCFHPLTCQCMMVFISVSYGR